MLPVLFRLGSFEVSSFGAMVALGAVAGLLLFRAELQRSGLNVSAGTDAALAGVLGGLAGAKLLYVLEHLDLPLTQTLLSRAGMSWFGGLLGGVAAGLALTRWRSMSLAAVVAAASPALALGQAIGRIGCFLVGDDYGTPTSLPWGVAFPEGLPPTTVPVHPTQIYEAVPLAVLAWLLVRWRREGNDDRKVLGGYMAFAGATRFAIEFVRVNERVVGSFSLAHLFSLAVGVVGLYLVASRRTAPVRT